MIDAYASYPHYFDHIKPIFDALPSAGTFYVSPSTKRPGHRTRGLLPSDDLLIVAGYPDLRKARRPFIFVEHGAGENYGRSDGHYSGGVGRDRVSLFLCPNRKVYEANEERYPGRSVIVGSPRLESLRKERGSGGEATVRSRPVRVVVSFHWNCRIHPQAGTGLFDYHHSFGSWAADSRIELAGHSHPRIASKAEKFFAAAGVPFIQTFDEVVRWADVYAVDNSSTLFEAVALGLPVVVLDASSYTSEETGFRFWKYADVGPRIQPGAHLPDAAIQAIDNLGGYADIRRQATAEIFGVVEGSTTKAVEAIEKHHGAIRSASSTDAGAVPAQPSLFRIP